MPSAISPGQLYRVATIKPGQSKPPGAVIVRVPATEPASETAVQALHHCQNSKCPVGFIALQLSGQKAKRTSATSKACPNCLFPLAFRTFFELKERK
jgi:hypothetical protein